MPKFLKIYPIVHTARALYKKKQYDAALKKAEEALELNEQHVEMQKLKADCLREIARRHLESGRGLLQIGDCEAARDVLENIQSEWEPQAHTEAQPLLSEAKKRIELGQVRRLVEKEAVSGATQLVRRGKLSEAIGLLRRVPEPSPGTRKLLNDLNQRQEEMKQRISEIRQALADEKIPLAQEVFDNVHVEMGAIPELLALEEEIRTAKLMERYRQSEQLFKQHKYNDAADVIDAAKKEGLGYLYEAVEEIIDQHREHHLSEGRAAIGLNTADGLQRARGHLNQTKRFTPEHQSVTELAQAIDRLEADLERNKKSTADEYVQKGEEHRKAEDYERALMYYDLALEIDGQHREAHRHREQAWRNWQQIQESWQRAQQEFQRREYGAALITLTHRHARHHSEKEVLLAEIEALKQQAEEIIQMAQESLDVREGLRLLREELPSIWPNWKLPIGLEQMLENKVECLEMVESAESDCIAGNVAKAIETLRQAVRKASRISGRELENAAELLNRYEKEYVEEAETQIQNLYNTCRFSDASEMAKEGFELFRVHSTDQRKLFQDWLDKIEATRKEMRKLCEQVRTAINQGNFTDAYKILRDLRDAYPNNPHAAELEGEIEKAKAAHEAKTLADGHCATGRNKLNDNLYREAIAAFDEALAVMPDHDEAKRWKAAAEKRASELEMKYGNAKGLFGGKQYRRAKPSLEELIREEPEIRDEASKMLTDINAILGKSEERYAALKTEEDARKALRIADEILSDDPYHPELLTLCPAIEQQVRTTNAYERGIEAENAGNLPSAVKELREAASLRSGQSPSRPLACFQQFLEIDAAVARVETSLKMQWLNEAEEDFKAQKYEQLLQVVDNALLLFPDERDFLDWRKRIEARRDEIARLYNQAELAEKNGQLQDCLAVLDELSKLDENHLDAQKLRQRVVEAIERQRLEAERQARAAALLEAIKAEPNPQSAWGKLNHELLRQVYPDYPPALEYKPTLETLIKAWEAYQRGLGYEKQDAMLRAAIDEYKQSLDWLRGLTIDVSKMEINPTVLESRMESAFSRWRNLLLAQVNQAMDAEQYETAERLAREGEREFPQVPDFAEILRKIKGQRQQVNTLLIQAESYLQIRERLEREASDIEEAKEAIATAEGLLSRILAIDPKHAEAEGLMEVCRDWKRATAEIAQAEGLHQLGETDHARDVITRILTRFPNRADARKLSETFDSVTPISGIIRLYVQEQPTDFIILPPDKEISIGSSSDNAIVLPGNLSRKQATINCSGNSYTLKHLSTSYSTTINGKTIKDSTTLRHGDKIGFASQPRLQFSIPTTGDSGTLEPIEDGFGTPEKIYVLMNNSATFGEYRKRNATIGLIDRSLSDPHARLIYEDSCYWLEPIASIEHDEKPCRKKTKLHPDSRITLGLTEMRVGEV